jgi:adenylate kinase
VPESVMMKRCLERSRSAIEEHSHTLQGDPKGNILVKDSRPDDQPEIVQRRLNLFYERTIPILEYYGYGKRLLTINGSQSPEQVQQEILHKLQI